MKTGYYGIPGTIGTKVHLVIDGRPSCGWQPSKLHEFQWCAHGIQWNYIECERCKDIARKIISSGMRKYGRTDANHTAIVTALRKAGCFVQSLASVGSGCPDILVSWMGNWFLMEIKDGTQPPSGRLLTKDENDWQMKAKAPVGNVESPEQALKWVGLLTT